METRDAALQALCEAIAALSIDERSRRADQLRQVAASLQADGRKLNDDELFSRLQAARQVKATSSR